MLERRHCSLVLIITGFAAVIFLMKSNIQILLSLQKSKYSGPFDPDVFIVTFNSYSNDKPTNLYSKSSFNRRKIYPWTKKDPNCQHLSVQVCSSRNNRGYSIETLLAELINIFNRFQFARRLEVITRNVYKIYRFSLNCPRWRKETVYQNGL